MKPVIPRGKRPGRPATVVDLDAVWVLVCERYSVTQISDELGLSRGTAQRAITRAIRAATAQGVKLPPAPVASPELPSFAPAPATLPTVNTRRAPKVSRATADRSDVDTRFDFGA